MKKTVAAQLISTFRVGGAEALALELCKRINRDHFRPIALALKENGPMEDRFRRADVGTHVIQCSEGRGLDLRCISRLASVLRREKVDVLHCHNRISNIYGAFAAKLARVPVVVCTRHASPKPRHSRGAKLLERAARPFTTSFIAVCRMVRDDGVRIGRLPADGVSVIYNGVDTTKFQPDNTCPPDVLSVICVARLSPEKRHTVLLKAVRRLANTGLEFRVLLVGDGPLRAVLQKQAKDLRLDAFVRFLGMRDDVADLLRSADIFVLPSATEGLPMTVIEAMAAGLPVVVTTVGGVPELVEDGETGLLIPPDCAEPLAEALGRLLKDAELRCHMGKAARRVAVERFELSL